MSVFAEHVYVHTNRDTGRINNVVLYDRDGNYVCELPCVGVTNTLLPSNADYCPPYGLNVSSHRVSISCADEVQAKIVVQENREQA